MHKRAHTYTQCVWACTHEDIPMHANMHMHVHQEVRLNAFKIAPCHLTASTGSFKDSGTLVV